MIEHAEYGWVAKLYALFDDGHRDRLAIRIAGTIGIDIEAATSCRSAPAPV